MKKYGLDSRQVVFEITEKQAVQDYCQLVRVLDNYRSQGFKIAIDDVGAGYNSLKTMIYLKPDFIKLDRSFTQNIDTQIAQQKLVQLFVQYASLSNTLVIAEGVERKEELQFLRKINVDFAQGYFIGKPSINLTNRQQYKQN
ncbi:EAL domain-containing protein [Anaerobacillus sp. HL2]|nr:EAL domain-containing protein [Anaerobacillus sp. HL2]